MAIYLDKLNTKLNAILAKDLDDIVARKVYLPFMGNSYTKAELQAWLDKRSGLLQKAKTLTEAQITQARKVVYNSLSAFDKLIADRIIAGEPYDFTPSDQDAYEKLVLIILYKFVTTP